MDTGQAILVSTDSAGTASGAGNSEDVAFAAIGMFLIFESFASDLTTLPDSNGGKDVFFRGSDPFADGFESGDTCAWSLQEP